MSHKKAVPHMTDIAQIFEKEDHIRFLLSEIEKNKYDKETAAGLLMNMEGIDLGKKSAYRYIGSLKTYHFIEENEDVLSISDISEDYLNGTLSYHDFILKAISQNIEWRYFLKDFLDILNENTLPLSRKTFLENLSMKDYLVGESERRYISEILKLLSIANIIVYEKGEIKTLLKKEKHVLQYVRKNQQEMLNLLLMAEKRVSKPTLRRIYRATVHSYLPLRENRNEIEKVQAEIDDIRKKGIKEQQKRIDYSGESKWELTDTLYDWQKDFLNRWMEKKNGIVEVVTGAGKTHLAMAIMQEMKKEFPDLKVTIIVPTIVLLEQWYQNLVYKLQLSPEEIALRGGGHTDRFGDKTVMISVINSAIKNEFIAKETDGMEHNLLIVDECHRAGAQEFRRIFDAHRNWNLGLSATPERESDNAFEEVLEKELGPIIGRFTYIDALEKGIIPRFNIYNYAVLLTREEQVKYDSLTKEIRKIVLRIKNKYPNANNVKNFEVYLKTLQKSHPKDRDLFLYFQKTKERKELVYGASNRKKLVKKILEKVLSEEGEGSKNKDSSDSPIEMVSSSDKAIVFHEKIDEVNSLYFEIPNTYVSIYHSGLPNSINRIGMDLYKLNLMRVLLSVKALIEGVDVPKANLGIIMASSSSQTQRIQSLGRVLRRAEGKDVTNLFIVYVKNTTDERVYMKTNWDEIIGKGNVEYRMWTEYGEVPIDPPQFKEKKEVVFDEEDLVPGTEYPGRYSGETYSFDSRGSVFRKSSGGRKYLDGNFESLWATYRKYKPTGGRFIVNEKGHVLIKARVKGKLETIYLGNLENDFGIHSLSD